MTCKERVLAIESDGADEILHRVGVNLYAAICQECLQAVPLVMDIGDFLPDGIWRIPCNAVSEAIPRRPLPRARCGSGGRRGADANDGGSIIAAEVHLAKRPKLFKRTESPLSLIFRLIDIVQCRAASLTASLQESDYIQFAERKGL